MATQFYSLPVSFIRQKTKACVEVGFEVPASLKESFLYKAGQYLTLETSIDGELVRRSYSLCHSPQEEIWSVAIKKISGGKFSTFANDQLKAGDIIHVMAPMGNFLLPDNPSETKNIVFFAAGSGITPVMAMIRQLLLTNQDTDITLFYGNRNVESVIFRDELEDLKNKYLDRLSIHHIFSREKVGIPILHGRLTGEKCRELADGLFDTAKSDQYYLCGPGEMIFSVKEALESMGVPYGKIHFELFSTTGLPSSGKETSSLSKEEEKQECEVQIQLDGEIIEFSLEYGGQNLLDAAIDNGADLPYSCKGGVCSTCKARVTEGQVSMDLNYALEPEEVASGYVLMCQAHPRSEKIFIDFDQK